MNLANFKVKAVLQSWSLAQIKGRSEDATTPVGQAVLFGSGGQTTEIADFDPVLKRVITRSGSVYELGQPNLLFAVKKRQLITQLGFN